MKTLRWLPFAYALRAIVALVFGLIMLLSPLAGLAAFVLLFAFFALADGIASIIAALAGSGRGPRWPLLLSGILGIALGVFFLLWPVASLAAFILFIAGWMVVVGIFTMMAGMAERRERGRGWALVLAGLLPFLFGLYLLVRPIIGLALLPAMIGGYAIFWGVLFLGTAFQLFHMRDSLDDLGESAAV